jgi:rare lipoprotein A
MGKPSGAAGRRESAPRRAPALLPGLVLTLPVLLALGGCGGTPARQEVAGGDHPPDAVPKVEPKSRHGNMGSYVVFGRRYYTKASSRDHRERGVASWYGTKFHGRKTSSGEIYDMHQMTAAHKTLPLPTYARVTNLENGRSAVVKINDRGPFVGDRVIDLSYAAAKKLDVVKKGTARVEIVSVDPRDHGERRAARIAAREVPKPEPRASAADPPEPVRTAARDDERPRRASPFIELPGQGPRPAGGSASVAAAGQRTPPARPERPAPAPVLAAKPAAPAARSAVAGPDTPMPTLAPVTAADAVASALPVIEPAAPAAEETVVVAAAAGPAPAPAGADSALSPAVYLQVGAFGDRGNAEQLRRRLLAELGEPILVREPAADAAAGRLYKVHVGPLDSRDRADALGRQLAARGIGAPMVVRQ